MLKQESSKHSNFHEPSTDLRAACGMACAMSHVTHVSQSYCLVYDTWREFPRYLGCPSWENVHGRKEKQKIITALYRRTSSLHTSERQEHVK